MPQRARVPWLANGAPGHRSLAPRLQCRPATHEPWRSGPKRVCSPVPTGPLSQRILVMSEGNKGAGSRGTSLVRARLQGADLQDAQFQGAHLYEAGLQGASLKDALFQGANLDDANLQGASLKGVSLQGASLRHTQLHGANLDRAKLDGALLVSASLPGASLQKASLRGASFDDVFVWRADVREAFGEGARVVAPRAGLRVACSPRVFGPCFWASNSTS